MASSADEVRLVDRLTGGQTTWVPGPTLWLTPEPIIPVQDPTFWPAPEPKYPDPEPRFQDPDPMFRQMEEPVTAWIRLTVIASQIHPLAAAVVSMSPPHAIFPISSRARRVRSHRDADIDRIRHKLLFCQYAGPTRPK